MHRNTVRWVELFGEYYCLSKRLTVDLYNIKAETRAAQLFGNILNIQLYF